MSAHPIARATRRALEGGEHAEMALAELADLVLAEGHAEQAGKRGAR